MEYRRFETVKTSIWVHLMVVVLLSFAALPAGSEELAPFQLEDQFGRAHSREDLQDRIVVVIGSDRDGSPYNGEWGQAIRQAIASEAAAERVEFLRVADLRRVPGFLKGHVKGRLRRRVEGAVLLDWQGRFAATYGFKPGSSNILVVGQDGSLVHQTRGREPAKAELQALTEVLRGLLRQTAGEVSSP